MSSRSIAIRGPSAPPALTHYTKPKLLIVDELGYLPLEANAAHLFFQLVSRRYERGSMLVTSQSAGGIGRARRLSITALTRIAVQLSRARRVSRGMIFPESVHSRESLHGRTE